MKTRHLVYAIIVIGILLFTYIKSGLTPLEWLIKLGIFLSVIITGFVLIFSVICLLIITNQDSYSEEMERAVERYMKGETETIERE